MIVTRAPVGSPAAKLDELIGIISAVCLALATPPEPEPLESVLREIERRSTEPSPATPPASPPEHVAPAPSEQSPPTSAREDAPLILSPVLSDPPAPPRVLMPPPIPKALRRPGAWIAGGTAVLAVSAVAHFIIPVLGQCRERELSCNDTGSGGDEAICAANTCNLGPIFALRLLSIPIDIATMTLFGFAGSAYGLRNARRNPPVEEFGRGRMALVGGGLALAAGGGALLIGIGGSGLIAGKPDPLGYPFAALRFGGVVLGATAVAMLGYAVSIWHGSVGVRAPSLTVRPMVGRDSLGVSFQLRRRGPRG